MIILITISIETFIMVDFWGWVGIASTVSLPIAGGVIAGALVIWQELRNQGNKFIQTKQELRIT